MTPPLTKSEKYFLLKIPRDSIEAELLGNEMPGIDESVLTNPLKEDGASFVTLTIDGELRGCIGSLEAHQPMFLDVMAHACHAAFQDYRFPPLTKHELQKVEIEISRLTAPVTLKFENPHELTEVLRPGVDGVILKDGNRKATFLPQVWDQLPEPEEFLSHLCVKMGTTGDLWRRKLLEVSLYQVEDFHEEGVN